MKKLPLIGVIHRNNVTCLFLAVGMKLWVLLCLLACLTPLTARQQDVEVDDNEFAEFEDEGKNAEFVPFLVKRMTLKNSLSCILIIKIWKFFTLLWRWNYYCLNLKVKLKKSCQIEIKENEIHHIPLLAFSVI